MASRGETWLAAIVGGALGGWLARLSSRVLRLLLVVLLAPLIWLWTQAVMFTGGIRSGTALLLGGILVVVVLAVWGRAMATTLWLERQSADHPAPADGGPDPEALYRWHEPMDVPYGARCACGKPRFPGELVYVGITNNLERRAKDDDRRAACWWHAGLEGKVKLYASRPAVEAAERRAIGSEHPRENIAHARRR